MRRIIVALAIVVVAAGGLAWWWFSRAGSATSGLVLYGNVEMREVSVAFNDSGRIADVLVEEGDRAKQGDVLARLDTTRLTPALAQAQAQVDAQAAAVEELHNGSLPAQIAQARASLDTAKANTEYARLSYERMMMLISSPSGQAAVNQSQVDQAKATYDAAVGQQDAAQQALTLLVNGPRREDVAQGEALLRADQAALALAQQQLRDAELLAPQSGVVRSRLMEPGEMASPQQPVLSLAILDPKWVRAYASEPDLPKIRGGMAATVSIDGIAKPLDGRVGFISPVAEFTPRSIQTETLRTSLVYEVRVLVSDPDDVLRLGMPATVRLASGASAAGAQP